MRKNIFVCSLALLGFLAPRPSPGFTCKEFIFMATGAISTSLKMNRGDRSTWERGAQFLNGVVANLQSLNASCEPGAPGPTFYFVQNLFQQDASLAPVRADLIKVIDRAQKVGPVEEATPTPLEDLPLPDDIKPAAGWFDTALKYGSHLYESVVGCSTPVSACEISVVLDDTERISRFLQDLETKGRELHASRMSAATSLALGTAVTPVSLGILAIKEGHRKFFQNNVDPQPWIDSVNRALGDGDPGTNDITSLFLRENDSKTVFLFGYTDGTVQQTIQQSGRGIGRFRFPSRPVVQNRAIRYPMFVALYQNTPDSPEVPAPEVQ